MRELPGEKGPLRELPADCARISPVRVAQIQAERSRLCEIVLRDLPEWFGIEEATAAYIRDVTNLPTFGIGEDALLSLKLHTQRAAEVYVTGVRRALHRSGLGPSRPDERPEGTRCFYEARGFVRLEEIHGLWGGTTRACPS
jgi:hypothetical protein